MSKNRIVLYALLLVFALLAAACNPDNGDQSYSLNVFTDTGTGTGYVSSTDGTIDCGPVCENTYTDNPVIELTAIADAGSEFAGWSGEDCAEGDPNGSTCSLTVDGKKDITATFNLVDDPGPGPVDPVDPETVEITLNLCEGDIGCNDAEEFTSQGDGDFDLGDVATVSSDLELNYEAEDRNAEKLIGLRFQPTLDQIPAGAVIDSIYIEFTPKASSDEDTLTLTIKAQTDPDPAEFTTADENISERLATDNGVTWQPAPWLEGVTGEATETPDLRSLLTDINWQPGNPIVFLIEGDGSEATRSAVSSDSVDNDNPVSNPSGPKLVVTYTPGS